MLAAAIGVLPRTDVSLVGWVSELPPQARANHFMLLPLPSGGGQFKAHPACKASLLSCSYQEHNACSNTNASIYASGDLHW